MLYYILTYGLTTIGAFGVIGVVERATGSDRMDAFLGLHKRNPLLAAVLLVLFLSLAGIPPLVGFWAKFNLFAVVLGVGAGRIPFALVALAVMLSAVSLYYYLQVLKRAFVMPAVNDAGGRGREDRHPSGDHAGVAGDRRGGRGDGLLPGAAAELDRELLPQALIRHEAVIRGTSDGSAHYRSSASSADHPQKSVCDRATEGRGPAAEIAHRVRPAPDRCAVEIPW